MIESPYLFVYGTLRAATGTEWSKYLTAASRLVCAGRTKGMLFQLAGYPGMTVSTTDDPGVAGDVYLLRDPTSSLPSLDAYEGCRPSDPLPHQFERQIVTVILDDGPTVQAWAYIYRLETEGKPRIGSGDYLHAGPNE